MTTRLRMEEFARKLKDLGDQALILELEKDKEIMRRIKNSRFPAVELEKAVEAIKLRLGQASR